MSAETLRRAAALMRERAKCGGPREYPTPWTTAELDVDSYGIAKIVHCHENQSGDVTDALDPLVADHIASWDPAVALAVADWLEHEAQIADDDAADGLAMGPRYPGLVLARAYLGEVDA